MARVWALLALIAALLPWPLVQVLLDHANDAPLALPVLQSNRDEAHPSDVSNLHPLVLMIIDGGGDIARLPFASELPTESVVVSLTLPEPTLTKPYLHAVLTGVPSRASGVRSNRFAGSARVDALTDRVRDSGGNVAICSPGLDFVPEIYGGLDDTISEDFDCVADVLEGRSAATLTIVHWVEPDGIAHRDGANSSAYRTALADASRIAAELLSARTDADVVVTSDHGHMPRGGHGGPEPEVADVSLVLRPAAGHPIHVRENAGADGDRREEHSHEMTLAQVAPLLAQRLGVQAPLLSVAASPTWLLSADTTLRPQKGHTRAGHVERLSRFERAGLERARYPRLWLVVFVAFMFLGTLKRSFSGWSLGTLLTPVSFAAAVWSVHRFAFERPFSWSAIDEIQTHGIRLVGLGIAAAAIASVMGMLSGLLRLRDRPTAQMALRRSAAGLVWSLVFSCAAILVWIDFGFGPWPLDAVERYLPLLALAVSQGALVSAAAILLLSSRISRPAP